jgi:hypothetical protein
METALQADSNVASPMAWSVTVGIYMFIVGTILSSGLYSILSVLAEVINLPVSNAGVVFASPALVFGGVAWWVIVERRDTRSYRHGVFVGVITALLTGLVWTTVFVAIWGIEMLIVPIAAFFVALVLGIAIIVGGLAGLPLMYARRQLNGTN